MEINDGPICVLQVPHRLPRHVGVVATHPIHFVLKFAVKIARIHDGIHLKLRMIIHLGRERGGTTRSGNVFATCGSRRLTWNTGWMCMEAGRARR